MIILSFTFFLVACTNENIDKEHLAYIENLGWTIKSFNASEQIVVEPAPETIENYKSSNITFIENYIGKELNITTYELKEKNPEGDNLRLIIYEYEGEIVGSIGEVPNYTPGIFNPSDKKSLEDIFDREKTSR
ncbi:DUF4830 domain-containing protein [Bacillus ndiopicus]|uniref:DUF4830 domain-containing protein n=1 Tax=Bacillus ndiopicus TaxID=1347368 RepID=UPI0005A7A1C1|nr:DUF4830 domain-containing protein [Bacillus ndiopicus]